MPAHTVRFAVTTCRTFMQWQPRFFFNSLVSVHKCSAIGVLVDHSIEIRISLKDKRIITTNLFNSVPRVACQNRSAINNSSQGRWFESTKENVIFFFSFFFENIPAAGDCFCVSLLLQLISFEFKWTDLHCAFYIKIYWFLLFLILNLLTYQHQSNFQQETAIFKVSELRSHTGCF